MMTIGYVRTSKEEQHPTNQIIALKEEGVERIFVDAGVSSMVPADEREGFCSLLRFVGEHPGLVDRLMVFEISRLGRSFLDTLTLLKNFEEEGIKVWSLSPKEAWSRTEDKSIRNLMVTIFAWVAEREREVLIERTKLGQARARAEGKKIGRPYRKVDWKKVDEMRAKRISLAGISRLLDIPYETLRRANKARHVNHPGWGGNTPKE
jgi:DNA invertase Pin-like site-specific DNA recombinase